MYVVVNGEVEISLQGTPIENSAVEAVAMG